jgi:hypothetical protein
LNDLNKAIELSEGKSKVACQAYTQRGLVERLEGRDTLKKIQDKDENMKQSVNVRNITDLKRNGQFLFFSDCLPVTSIMCNTCNIVPFL